MTDQDHSASHRVTVSIDEKRGQQVTSTAMIPPPAEAPPPPPPPPSGEQPSDE